MSNLHLEIADGKTKYRPGEMIEGVAFWELPELPKVLELRLFWRTQGKGTVDHQVVATVAFDGAQPTDRRPFRFALPAEPYSVSGILVSIVWGLELVAEPNIGSAAVEIVLSPTGEEVRLEKKK
jgi:hypothetical protein